MNLKDVGHITYQIEAGIVYVEFPWRQAVYFRDQKEGLVEAHGIDHLELCTHQFVRHVERFDSRHGKRKTLKNT